MTAQASTTEQLKAAEFAFTETITVAAPPALVYDLISEVSNIGRWSPTADLVAYDEGGGPFPGAWFTGTNLRGDKRWESRSEVEIVDRPATFAFVVGGVQYGIVRWLWQFTPHPPASTDVALNWSLLRLDPVLGNSRKEILELQNFMQVSVQTTLDALAQHLDRQDG